MRLGELLGLTWRELDLEAGRLRVSQQLIPSGGAFRPPKTRASERTIALDPETVAALERHRSAQLVERSLAGDAYRDLDLVFAAEGGHGYPHDVIRRRFAALRKQAGIPTGTPHVLRHTAATLALTSGVPVHVVAARLGDDPRTVLGVYSHLLPASDELAAERIAAALA